MLDPTTRFIVDLFLLLGGSVIAGELATRLGQPALVGQLLAGVVLGPTLFGSTSYGVDVGLGSLSSMMTSLQLLATIFILFMAGLEVVPEQLYRMPALTVVMGVCVFIIPFLVSASVVPLVIHGISATTSLYVALTLSITALPVMGIMLHEFGLVGSKMGTLLMNVALINELTAVTVFAILYRLGSGGTAGYIGAAIAALSVALFISIMLTIHMLLRVLREAHLWEPLQSAFARTWRSKQGNFALLMVMLVGSTLLSQYLGLTYVAGAFYAGILVTRQNTGEAAHRAISQIFDTMTWGFFVPLFFAFVGVEMNLRELFSPISVLATFGALLAVGIVAKVVVGAGFARLHGWRDSDALAIGYMVGSRGAVELAMATILFQSGLINTTIFTLIASVGLVTTIVAPIGALRSWLSDPKSRAELYARVPSLSGATSPSRRLQPPMDWEEMRRLYYREPTPLASDAFPERAGPTPSPTATPPADRTGPGSAPTTAETPAPSSIPLPSVARPPLPDRTQRRGAPVDRSSDE